MSADDLTDLPDLSIEPGPAGGGEGYDPVLELHKLTAKCAEGLNALTQQGVNLQDSHTMITQLLQTAMLEEILRTVGGEGAVTRTLLKVYEQMDGMISTAESQVRQAKLAAPGGMPPQMGNGNRAARRR
jgi:hypothetical protein